jgi:hypothetical protein
VSAPRCRWHTDGGRCTGIVAAPNVAGVPELCPAHLAAIEPWARTRAAQGATAEHWIAHMRHRAGEAWHLRRALGEEPPLYRPGPAAGNNTNGSTA